MTRQKTGGRDIRIRRNPYTNHEYPWMIPTYRARDDLGRSPQLREGGMGWSA